MTETITMQTVLSRFLPGYEQHRRLSPDQGKVCYAIGACRTEVLGGQYVHCDQCDFTQHRYHSCRNRHCPKCQHHATQQWCEQQLQQVLPVNYFHVVFTLPHEINPWVQCHADVIYRCLFQSVWRTIKRFGQDPKRLNGNMGMTAVLHTWGQNLSQHVHLHCLIPGGALSQDQRQWQSAKSNYLFPVKALSRHFRGAMVSALRGAYQRGELHRLCIEDVEKGLSQLIEHEWVVYSKAYLKKAETIVRYLGRYTHKIALSDARIRDVKDDLVTFHYKDYRDNKDKCMQLNGEEFIRRFLMHVLPNGFMRIRHYGFLSNRSRRQKLDIIRSCLHSPAEPVMTDEPAADVSPISNMTCPCPKCKAGHLQIRYEIPPKYIKGEVTTHA
jgi:hypothetical protein